MSKAISVVDYGSGNLLSVLRALEHCGAAPCVVSDEAGVLDAERLLLPGVGAFGDGMKGLDERELVGPILRYASMGRPLLGICLGMQMLADISEEFGEHRGLGLIGGRVVPIPASDVDGKRHKIPHIGWSGLAMPTPDRWAGTVLQSTPAGTAFYLVHSFRFEPANEADTLAECVYGGHRIVAAVQREGIVGLQFHPEKSGEAGLSLLRTFLEL